MFKEINLEISMKPFKENTPEYIEAVINKVYSQWATVLKDRERISILFWVSDGSEILDYTGDMDKEIEWAYFAGTAINSTAKRELGKDICLHDQNIKYMENPPVVTYRVIKNIIEKFKEIGKKYHPDAEIKVGVPFDIGPEFAISDFKYTRHPEICKGEIDCGKTFVDSCGILKGDTYPYAGYPAGIPDGTPFGTFLGRQTQIYLDDLGFDYLWLSNGMGFSATPWSPTGDIYDGKEFHTEKFEECRNKVFEFWTNFRKECKEYPVYTRGTNYSTGIDYAVDAVDMYKLYNADLNIVPPPNSPWAAINGDYGLELMGHMARNCELPGDKFMFRFYLHDPWWANTPWYDRYNESPHDIYLPMAISRIDENGRTRSAEIMNVLTIDNTMGDMPDRCVYETAPHYLRAEKDAADAPAPFVWVYPFREFNTPTAEDELKRIIGGDLFMRRAISNGFPLSTVVSCDNFIKHNKDIYTESVLVTPVPIKGSEFEKQVFEYIEEGGRVLFYGNIDFASEKFLNTFKITAEEMSGDVEIKADTYPDNFRKEATPDTFIIRKNVWGKKLPSDMTLTKEYKNAVWYLAPLEMEALVCNSDSNAYVDPHSQTAWGTVYLREVLKKFGYEISFSKYKADSKSPVVMINKHNNANIFTVFSPDSTAETVLKFPLGAPILDGYEVELRDGSAVYHFPKCEHKECRVYVEQKDGVVQAKGVSPGSMINRRRIEISGLKNATVRFFGESYCKDIMQVATNVVTIQDKYNNDCKFDGEYKTSKEHGTYFEARNITGNILFSMPHKDLL